MEEKSSRGSKINLNESTLPLLDDQEVISCEVKGDTPEKERIEMETRSADEKGDEGTEKTDDTAQEDGSNVNNDHKDEKKDGDDKEKKKKEKKEKKEKKKENKGHRRTVSCADTLTIGLNLLDRDEKRINDQVNLVFEDVMAEPDATQGFDGVWRLSYVVFSGTKQWAYKILSAILAIPCGIAWGLIFSILTLTHVWLLTPLLRTLDVVLHVVKRIWGGVVSTLLDPVFKSAGLLLSSVNVTKTSTHQEVYKEP